MATQDHRVRVAAEKRERMRARLLQSAFEVMADKGPEGTTVDDIVQAAGVARGSFYKYFAAPSDLLRELAQELAGDLIRTVNASVRDRQDPAERAAIGLRAVLGFARRSKTLARFIVRAGWPVSQPGHAFFAVVGPNVDRGLATGRFRPTNREIPLMLIGGLTVGAMQALESGELSADFECEVAETLLLGLGLTPGEASRISRLPYTMPENPTEGLLARVDAPRREAD